MNICSYNHVMGNTIKHLKALSDPTRLRIMLLLLEEELCVCELESVLGMEQSRISHALRTLRDANLISERREGRWVFYRANESLPETLLAYLRDSGNEQILRDHDRMIELLEGAALRGKRCPLRDEQPEYDRQCAKPVSRRSQKV